MDTKTMTYYYYRCWGHGPYANQSRGSHLFQSHRVSRSMVFHPEQKKSHGFLDQMICSKLPKTPKLGGTRLNNMRPYDYTLPENQQLYNLSESNIFAWTGHLVETMFVKQNGRSNTLALLGPRWW